MLPISFPRSATLALCVLLTAPSTIAAIPVSVLAQSASGSGLFELPESVADGTVVRIDGSDSMSRVNQVLQQGFEEAYPGTAVQVAYSGTAAALAALESGDIDLAAIGRPLTDEEKARGLRETAVERHKIAMIVGPSNEFNGSLTTPQFAQIFRGEITDWAEVGGEPGAIRLVDRPEESDTRQAFRGYPVFKAAPFEAVDTADTVPEDSTEAVIAALGEDGIGYAIAEQVFDNPDVKIVPMHNTLPDDPRYPFSQPLTYVYQESASPAAQAFLGYAAAPINSSALEAARVEGAIASIDGPAADGALVAPSAGGTTGAEDGAPTEDATADNSAAVSGTASGNPAGDEPVGAADDIGETAAAGTATDDGVIATTPADPELAPVEEAEREGGFPWWLLLLLGIPLLLWLLLRRRPAETPPAAAPAADADPVAAPTPAPDVDPVVGMAPGTAPVPPAVAVPEFEADEPETTSLEANSLEATRLEATRLEANSFQAAAGAAAIDPTDSPAASDRLPYGASIPPVVPVAPISRDDGAQIRLTPTAPHTLRAEWTVPEAEHTRLRNAGGKQMAVRLHDVTGLSTEAVPHRTWQFPCIARDTALNADIPDAAATYQGELGYLTGDNRWLALVRSLPVTPSPDNGLSAPATVGLAAGVAGAAVAGVAATARGSEPASGTTHLSLSPQLSNTIQADWALSSQDSAEAAAQPSGLLLRLYDATGLDLVDGLGPLVGEYHCDETVPSLQVPVAQGDRDYAGELGYLSEDGGWVPLARSEKVRLVSPTTDAVTGTVTGPAAEARLETGTRLDTGIDLDEGVGPGLGREADLGTGAGAPALGDPDANIAAAAAAAAAMAVATSSVAASETAAEPAVSPSAVAGSSTVALQRSESGAAVAHWSVAEGDQLKLQGPPAKPLELRVHDVTAIDLDHQTPHNTQTYTLSPTTHEQPVTVPVGDRDYLAELGYLGGEGWVSLARSGHLYIPGDSPAVSRPGQVATDGPDAMAALPADAMAGAAIAVGLGAVAPSMSMDSTEAGITAVEPLPEAAEISRIILVPCRAQQAYAYWEISDAQAALLKAQGGQFFKLRVHDATGLDIDYQPPHQTMEFDCSETDRDRHVPIPAGDRDYIAEVGYTTAGGDWLRLIRSFHTWIPQ